MNGEAGKGSKRRPKTVSQEVYEKNYRKALREGEVEPQKGRKIKLIYK